MHGESIDLPEAPAIAGLRFRRFAGDEDYAKLADLMNEIAVAEGSAPDYSAELMRNFEGYIHNFDPILDRVLVEVHGNLIGAGRVQTNKTVQNERLLMHSINIASAWRGRGIERAMLRQHQTRLREIAATLPVDAPRYFQAWGVKDDNLGLTEVLVADGYAPVRCSYEMVRPNLDDIPDRPLPEGLEIRPIREAHLPAIWDAREEAFQDHWGKTPAAENAYESWRTCPDWNREMSRVAWAGDQCAGIVQIFIGQAYNRTAAKKRGYTEAICVRRPWRRKGVASALIASCLHALRDAGFHEAALGVDSENLSGALRIYETMGYQVKAKYIAYRREFS